MTRSTLDDPAAGNRLARFFSPRSIALVGASDRSGWTRNVLRSLDVGGYSGELVLVNAKHRRVAGRETVPSVRDRPADLAYIMTGQGPIAEILTEAAEAGVTGAVILAAGYGESGTEGARRQRELATLASKLGITLLGPNSLGFVNPGECTPYASAITVPPERGRIGFVLQSGSIASSLIGYCATHGVGVRLLASMGNEAQLGCCDIVEYLLEDEETTAIALFLEAIREPPRFRSLARACARAGKPLIVLKSGRSPQGARAALAHTGALASDDAVVDAVFRQDAIVRVFGLEEMIVTAALLGGARRLPAGRRMTAVGSSGGGGNLIADRATDLPAELPEFEPATVERLRAMLPEFATVQNPIDVTGTYQANIDAARASKPEDDVLELLVRDRNLDLAVLVMTPLPSHRDADDGFSERRLPQLKRVIDGSPIPVFPLWLIDRELPPYARDLLAAHDMFVLPGIELGLRAVGHALDWSQRRDRQLVDDEPPVSGDSDPEIGRDTLTVLDEDSARRLVAEYGVPLVPATLVTDAAQARAAAVACGQPVAVKLCAAGLAHKSDIGGVRLGVRGPDKVAEAFSAVTDAGARAGHDVRGALVAPMRNGGVELVAGITVDATFGPVLTVGVGGTWVEKLAERSIRPLPVNAGDVLAMLGELRMAPLLFGGRGVHGVDVDAVGAAVAGMCRAATALGPRLEAIEVNPLLAKPGGAEALDVLIVTRGGQDAGRDR